MFNSQSPIYLQLYHLFIERIVTKDWTSGSQLPSVRELALEYEVNPNTIQKALSILDDEGITYIKRGSGRFITEDVKMIKALKDEMLKEILDELVHKAQGLGFTTEDLISQLKKKEKTDE